MAFEAVHPAGWFFFSTISTISSRLTLTVPTAFSAVTTATAIPRRTALSSTSRLSARRNSPFVLFMVVFLGFFYFFDLFKFALNHVAFDFTVMQVVYGLFGFFLGGDFYRSCEFMKIFG